MVDNVDFHFCKMKCEIGWMGGWMHLKEVLRIAYSNQIGYKTICFRG
jgi:hypothetical protein